MWEGGGDEGFLEFFGIFFLAGIEQGVKTS